MASPESIQRAIDAQARIAAAADFGSREYTDARARMAALEQKLSAVQGSRAGQ